MKQRAEITFETRESVIVRQDGETIESSCGHAGSVRFRNGTERLNVLSEMPDADIARLIASATPAECADRDHWVICLSCLLTLAEEFSNI